jgi:hypothetical protein
MRATRIVLATLCVATLQFGALAREAAAQDDWNVAVYPILAWVPLSIGIDVEIPPFEGGTGGTGTIVDSRFDGAFLGGLTASNGTWHFEGDGIWAAFGGDRAESPFLTVDVDVIYGHANLGRRVAPDLYLTAGVRYLALKYNIVLGDLPRFARTPGLWNPLVGIAWHRPGAKVDWHAGFEGGGFGVGADVDLAGSLRVDWKPTRHFGFTAGYNILYLKATDKVQNRTVTVEPMLHGPVVGIGLYF